MLVLRRGVRLPVIKTPYYLLAYGGYGREHSGDVFLTSLPADESFLRFHLTRFRLGNAEVLLYRKRERVPADIQGGRKARQSSSDDGELRRRLADVYHEYRFRTPMRK